MRYLYIVAALLVSWPAYSQTNTPSPRFYTFRIISGGLTGAVDTLSITGTAINALSITTMPNGNVQASLTLSGVGDGLTNVGGGWLTAAGTTISLTTNILYGLNNLLGFMSTNERPGLLHREGMTRFGTNTAGVGGIGTLTLAGASFGSNKLAQVWVTNNIFITVQDRIPGRMYFLEVCQWSNDAISAVATGIWDAGLLFQEGLYPTWNTQANSRSLYIFSTDGDSFSNNAPLAGVPSCISTQCVNYHSYGFASIPDLQWQSNGVHNGKAYYDDAGFASSALFWNSTSNCWAIASISSPNDPKDWVYKSIDDKYPQCTTWVATGVPPDGGGSEPVGFMVCE